MNKLKLGLDISESEYRDINLPSYSYLADLAKSEVLSPGGALEKILYGVRDPNIGDLDGVLIGSIVDSNLTEGKDPFNLIVTNKKPGGKMLSIIRGIVKNKHLMPNPTDILSPLNDVAFEQICAAMKYKKTYNQRVEGVRNYEEYIEALDKYQDPFIVSKFIYNTAKRTEKVLREEYPFVINPQDFNLEKYSQIKLKGTYNGQECKGMLDMVFINHSKKMIVPFDLKTGYAKHTDFLVKCYLGWYYYLQAALYSRLLKQEIDKHPELKDYKVLPFQFMYCGRSDFQPLLYKVTTQQDEEALTGFTQDGINYPGLDWLIDLYKTNIGRRKL